MSHPDPDLPVDPCWSQSFEQRKRILGFQHRLSFFFRLTKCKILKILQLDIIKIINFKKKSYVNVTPNFKMAYTVIDLRASWHLFSSFFFFFLIHLDHLIKIKREKHEDLGTHYLLGSNPRLNNLNELFFATSIQSGYWSKHDGEILDRFWTTKKQARVFQENK